MTAQALLNAHIAKRQSPRYIFRRRCLMAVGSATLQVKTLDVCEQGFGVIASEPVVIGKPCTIILNGVIGERISQHIFSCETVYCILSGVDGFRIGLHVNNYSSELEKKQLQTIIASCSNSFN